MKRLPVKSLQWQHLPKPAAVCHLTLARCTINDGDTIKGTHTTGLWPFQQSEIITIRLAGINCPEYNEPLGDTATAFTTKFCQGKTVIIEYARDRHKSWIMEGSGYGRLLGFVWRGGDCLNMKLVRKGLAHLYEKPDWMTGGRKRQLLRAAVGGVVEKRNLENAGQEKISYMEHRRRCDCVRRALYILIHLTPQQAQGATISCWPVSSY